MEEASLHIGLILPLQKKRNKYKAIVMDCVSLIDRLLAGQAIDKLGDVLAQFRLAFVSGYLQQQFHPQRNHHVAPALTDERERAVEIEERMVDVAARNIRIDDFHQHRSTSTEDAKDTQGKRESFASFAASRWDSFALALERAGHQAAQEVTTEEDINEQRWQGRQQGGRHQHIPLHQLAAGEVV